MLQKKANLPALYPCCLNCTNESVGRGLVGVVTRVFATVKFEVSFATSLRAVRRLLWKAVAPRTSQTRWCHTKKTYLLRRIGSQSFCITRMQFLSGIRIQLSLPIDHYDFPERPRCIFHIDPIIMYLLQKGTHSITCIVKIIKEASTVSEVDFLQSCLPSCITARLFQVSWNIDDRQLWMFVDDDSKSCEEEFCSKWWFVLVVICCGDD